MMWQVIFSKKDLEPMPLTVFTSGLSTGIYIVK
jgi:hypothetical protein